MPWSDLIALVKDAVFGPEDLLSNRRKLPRIVMNLPVLCRTEKPDLPDVSAELVDLGLRGMRLGLPQRVKRGQIVVVSALPGDGIVGRTELRCCVVWCRQNRDGKIQAGVVYKDTSENLATSWVHYLLLQRHCPAGERKDRRIEATLPVEVGDASGEALMVGQILDLSLGGAKIRFPSRLPPGERFVLKIGANDPKVKPVILDSQTVGQPQDVIPCDVHVSGQSDTDVLYNFKFAGSDSQQRPLKRLLLSLLKDLRREKRPKSQGLSGVRVVLPPPPSRPSGPLAGAVSSGFLDSPKKAEKTSKPRISKFLQSQPPGFLKGDRPKRESPWQAEPQPKWRMDPIEPEEVTAQSLGRVGGSSPGRRPMVEGMVAVQFPRLEVARGWFHPCYLGNLPLYSWLPDQLPRPTEEFFLAVAPLLPGCSLIFGLRHLCVWTRNGLGPGLVWSDRQAFAVVLEKIRRPRQWLSSTVSMRERLERHLFSLQERLLHLLAVQGLGGGQAVRSLVACAQIACAVACELEIQDSLQLNHLRLAALLKDIGESTLVLGLAPHSLREGWSFYLHGVSAPKLELDELNSDWVGFRVKSHLLASRHAPGPEVVELLPLHPLVGEGFLNDLGFPPEVVQSVRSHHEAFNGSGYPDGLTGYDIPWSARCLAVADAFAGLLAEDTPPAVALGLVRQAGGQMFDPEYVSALERYLKRRHLV